MSSTTSISPCDLQYTIGLEFTEPEHFTVRAVAGTLLTHGACERHSDGYVIEAAFPVTDAAYKATYNINCKHHLQMVCQLTVGKSRAFFVASGDTILAPEIARAIRGGGQHCTLSTRGFMENVTPAHAYTATFTAEVVCDKHVAHIERISLRIPHAVFDEWTRRLEAFCRQLTFIRGAN